MQINLVKNKDFVPGDLFVHHIYKQMCVRHTWSLAGGGSWAITLNSKRAYDPSVNKVKERGIRSNSTCCCHAHDFELLQLAPATCCILESQKYGGFLQFQRNI